MQVQYVREHVFWAHVISNNKFGRWNSLDDVDKDRQMFLTANKEEEPCPNVGKQQGSGGALVCWTDRYFTVYVVHHARCRIQHLDCLDGLPPPWWFYPLAGLRRNKLILTTALHILQHSVRLSWCRKHI